VCYLSGQKAGSSPSITQIAMSAICACFVPIYAVFFLTGSVLEADRVPPGALGRRPPSHSTIARVGSRTAGGNTLK
jgi:hypothetical protein